MSYQVLARKWRPQCFADVLGQKHITRTLQNAIKSQRVGHAYLFVGSRGIGKTTSARIFAKALNCTNPQTDAEGYVEPCCQCESCIEIAAGNCLDVIEIDGASHNKVEDVRELCENVQYTPTNGRQYKIYIIDEVHMLTTQAWNALLKTLEEPPPHAKFLFATTESHKVLATILSRTQRFDLKRIPPTIIVERLRWIADKEGVFIDDGALNIIARAAEGGMRDAQSIFDQMIAFCGGMDAASTIKETDVIEVFGMTSMGELHLIESAMLTNDPATMVESIHNLADKGRDLEKLYGDILQGLRNIMVYQVVKDPEKILEISTSELEEIKTLSGQAKSAVLQRLVEGMLSYGDRIRHTLNKRVFIEVTLLKILQDAHAVQVNDLISVLRKWDESGTMPELPGISTEKKKHNDVESSDDERSGNASQPLNRPMDDIQSVQQPENQSEKPLPASYNNQNNHPAPLDPAPDSMEALPSPNADADSLPDSPPEPEMSDADDLDASYSAPADELISIPPPQGNPTPSVERTGAKFKRGPEILERVQRDPFVQKLVDEFDGKVVDACTKTDDN